MSERSMLRHGGPSTGVPSPSSFHWLGSDQQLHRHFCYARLFTAIPPLGLADAFDKERTGIVFHFGYSVHRFLDGGSLHCVTAAATYLARSSRQNDSFQLYITRSRMHNCISYRLHHHRILLLPFAVRPGLRSP